MLWLKHLIDQIGLLRSSFNKPIRHVVCAGALGQVKTDTQSHATKTS